MRLTEVVYKTTIKKKPTNTKQTKTTEQTCFELFTSIIPQCSLCGCCKDSEYLFARCSSAGHQSVRSGGLSRTHGNKRNRQKAIIKEQQQNLTMKRQNPLQACVTTRLGTEKDDYH